jgi:hypothetical protein
MANIDLLVTMELFRLTDKHRHKVNVSTVYRLLNSLVLCTKTFHVLADCYALSF